MQNYFTNNAIKLILYILIIKLCFAKSSKLIKLVLHCSKFYLEKNKIPVNGKSGIRWPRKRESREGRSIGWNNRSSCRYVSSSSAKVSLTPSSSFSKRKNTHARYRWHETTTRRRVHLLCQGLSSRREILVENPPLSFSSTWITGNGRPKEKWQCNGGTVDFHVRKFTGTVRVNAATRAFQCRVSFDPGMDDDVVSRTRSWRWLERWGVEEFFIFDLLREVLAQFSVDK